MNFRHLFAVVIAGLFGSVAAHADQHVFWEVSGKRNTVYLLGSVHVLKSTDAALPSVVEAAYLDAETIVEELDPVAAAAEMAGGAVLKLQALPEGQTLAGVLGPELHARLQKEAALLHIDMDFLSRIQPWYVALMVMQTRLVQSGFSASDGVDNQIAMRAQRDSKPLRGLETAMEQLSLFANMPLDDQREFLRSTLDEQDVADEVAEITAAWRSGDLTMLESLLRGGAEESPQLFQALTTDRNLRWLPQIEAMLDGPRNDYLVVTGALHMVGDMGVVELLRRKGYKIKRR
ncbi:MAG: TraB/GumN family protein [Pseudomonadota bacterium]